MLNQKDQRVCAVLTKLVAKEIKLKEAMRLLGLSKRQILRKKKRFVSEGVVSVKHASRGRALVTGASREEKRKIIKLYKEEYLGWNHSHFHDTLVEAKLTTRSLSFVTKLLVSEGCISSQSHRHKTKSHPPRKRRENFGELSQVDASAYQWFAYCGDNNYYHLHGGIDDSSGIVVGAYLQKQETIVGYQQVLKQQLENYGLPECWYSDFRTIFQSPKKALTLDEEIMGKKLTSTKFTQMLDKLGIKIISTTSPQAKGKIERLWRTFQDRLGKELAKHGFTTLNEVNHFIQTDFLPRYNARFARSINPDHNVSVKLDGNFDYNRNLAVFEYKSVYHRCYLKHHQQYLVILNPISKKPASLLTRSKVKLYTLLDGTLEIEHGQVRYSTESISIQDIKTTLVPKVKPPLLIKVKTTTPAVNHPWRNTSKNWLARREENCRLCY